MNIAIVRAFIAMRKFMIQYQDVIEQIELLKNKLGRHDIQLNQIYEAIENLLQDKTKQKTWSEREQIGFKK